MHHRDRYIAHLKQVISRSRYKPWFPPYGGLEHYLFYSSLIPWRVAPGLFLCDGGDLHLNTLRALLAEVTDAGIAATPKAADVRPEWKKADFGTTCALIALLHERSIRAAAEENDLLPLLEAKLSQLLSAVGGMLEDGLDCWELLCSEDASGILDLARFQEYCPKLDTLQLLESLSVAINDEKQAETAILSEQLGLREPLIANLRRAAAIPI